MTTYEYELCCPTCKTEENTVGHKVPEICDEVFFWSCQGCGFAWPRDWEAPYRKVMSQVYAARHNEKRVQS